MNLRETIRTILKEEKNINIRLRRRLDMLDYEIESRMGKVYRPDNVCSYESDEELLDVVMEAAIDSMYHNYFADIDDGSEEWPEIYYDMVKYIRYKYGEQIKSYYNENCGSKKNEMREGELSEKCWRGYTQKGMQSMMGVISEGIYSNTNINIGDIYEESDIYTYVQKLHHKRKEDFWEGNLGERIEKYPFYIVKEIPIEQIEMDEFQVDDDDVEEYVELFKKLNSYPPIVLTKKQYGYYYIIDGTHRANALRELGLKTIICFVGKKKTQEMKEGELTEKCWPGYTQKGMKTMFGKRYPNCVKKTKK